VEVIFLEEALADLDFWKRSGKKQVMRKIRSLIEEIQVKPFEGLGKPEPLKHELTGKWSRRITKEDRMVYRVTEMQIIVYSLKGHY
jgi:toxin YoeB